MEMKEVICREGRDAKNLLVYQICDDRPLGGILNYERTIPPQHSCRKPPKSSNALVPCQKQTIKTSSSPPRNSNKQSTGPRVRSASTGRDKKSELQARYWALLFGNLQRAVNEIYQTVECYENISSCQEAILVLENYVRDFKALSEWFRVSWDYESKPVQQRPHSLAWEVRKSNPAPRVRAKSLSSPTISGKSSPSPCLCNSGKSSPSLLPGESQSPRRGVRVNVRELFSSSKRPLSEVSREAELLPHDTQISLPFIEVPPMHLENRCHQYAQTDLEDDHLTLAGIREKMQREKEEREAQRIDLELVKLEEKENTRDLTAVEMTVQQLNCMEDALLAKNVETNVQEDYIRVETHIKGDSQKKSDEIVAVDSKTSNSSVDQNDKLLPPYTAGQINSPLKYSSVLNRPVASFTNNVNTAKSVTLSKSSSAKTSAVKSTASLPHSAKFVTNANLRRSVPTNTAPTSHKISLSARLTLRNSKPKCLQSSLMSNNKTGDCSGQSLNPTSRLSARSRTMIEIKAKDEAPKLAPKARRPSVPANRALYSVGASSSRRSSRDEIGSSTSTLKASNERISITKSINSSNAEERKSEPKQLPSSDNNDGWLTVKNRRRSSMHWSSRFNQPTGYASLPTLALFDEKRHREELILKPTSFKSTTSGTETDVKSARHIKTSRLQDKISKPLVKPEIKNAKAKINSLPAHHKSSTQTLASVKKEALVLDRNPISIPSRQSIIKRQKSDLTGLKMTSLHKEYMRSEKIAQRKLNNGGTKSSEVLSNGHIESGNNSNRASSTETIVEAQNSSSKKFLPSEGVSADHNKIDIKIQTNRDFSKTIGDLYRSISSKADHLTIAGESLSNGVIGTAALSSCDENDECDEHQRLLVEEQESLERQIRELESTEIDVDTETDETDCEVGVLENDHDDHDDERTCIPLNTSAVVFVPVKDSTEDEKLSLETRYQALLSEMSWGEREEALATLQAYVSRHPGRAQELHQKLSSPSRRRSLQETLKKYQAKQARAQQKRETLQKEKTIKIQQLLARVEDVKAAKRQLIEDKRLKMEGRLQRAAENREQYLRQIIEKAHDEEKKLKEINFIKNIEAQNKRLDLIESSKETEGRLQDLEQERQKRMEEKAAKEAAVERRRQELEKEWQRKLEKINESRLEKEQRVGKMQEQKEKQRQALAREKARDREERLLALQVQQQQTTEELQRKILQKQKESARRHEENIEHIRQRALELTIPSRNLEENATSRLESAESQPEDGDLSSTVSDVGSREHTRGYKKKIKKLKLRMSHSADEYFKELQPVPLHMKRESQVPKYLNLVNKGGGAQGLERALGQLMRIMSKAQVFDFQCFLLMDGLGALATNVIAKSMQEDSEVSKKAVVSAVQLYRNACTLCPQIARHAMLGNSLPSLFDALFQSLQLPEEKSPQHPVELSTELMLACTVAMSPSYTKKHTHPKILERLPDLISYAVMIGLIEILSRRCMKIRESIESHQGVVLSLLATLGFITKFIDVCPVGPADSTRFLSSAKSTELFGSISMLYASVVPIGSIKRGSNFIKIPRCCDNFTQVLWH
ncbi:S phase cyclin A-associated protein in the endoplasmic reticulum isoform X2 [Glossina fuscipes]|uniref:S phase cyclin A-associated protein in the endoplasmic reticulum isoform X2 n=1 Tax=Glossina fuscipes TaxID=7396 RepID=A0A8U0WAC9_9MUSC|nr:S phase cyclin A-associated protein in the endoplasmic reticulum isoform X2 [Glossina fuscipes]